MPAEIVGRRSKIVRAKRLSGGGGMNCKVEQREIPAQMCRETEGTRVLRGGTLLSSEFPPPRSGARLKRIGISGRLV